MHTPLDIKLNACPAEILESLSLWTIVVLNGAQHPRTHLLYKNVLMRDVLSNI